MTLFLDTLRLLETIVMVITASKSKDQAPSVFDHQLIDRLAAIVVSLPPSTVVLSIGKVIMPVYRFVQLIMAKDLIDSSGQV